MLQWLREQRRLHLLAQPFPETWDSFLFRDVAHYPLLSEDQRGLSYGTTCAFSSPKNTGRDVVGSRSPRR